MSTQKIMIKEIEKYIINNYYQLLAIAKKITKGNPICDELLHECLLQLYERDEIILKEYDDNSIKYYITAVMRINYHSNTSPFHNKYRKNAAREFPQEYEMEDTQYNWERDILIDITQECLSQVDTFYKELFELYLLLGKQNKVADQINVSNSTVNRAVSKVRKEVKNKVNKRMNI